MGKKAKEHRMRVAKRNQRIAEEKNRREKAAMNFLQQLIQRENAEGKFDNPVMPLPNFDSFNPTLGLPIIGPSLGLTNPQIDIPQATSEESNVLVESQESNTPEQETQSEQIQ